MSLSRHQLIKATQRDNPDLPYNSPLFRECVVLNASIQESTIDLQRLASFTGMSKGEVQRHLINIGKKLKDAEKREKDEPTNETVEVATTERESLESANEADLSTDVFHGDVPPIGT